MSSLLFHCVQNELEESLTIRLICCLLIPVFNGMFFTLKYGMDMILLASFLTTFLFKNNNIPNIIWICGHNKTIKICGHTYNTIREDLTSPPQLEIEKKHSVCGTCWNLHEVSCCMSCIVFHNSVPNTKSQPECDANN